TINQIAGLVDPGSVEIRGQNSFAGGRRRGIGAGNRVIIDEVYVHRFFIGSSADDRPTAPVAGDAPVVIDVIYVIEDEVRSEKPAAYSWRTTVVVCIKVMVPTDSCAAKFGSDERAITVTGKV